MFLSVFDLFKIGIGPSSSHTVGPMVAARRFLTTLATLEDARRLHVGLYGSLAFTGEGHGTGQAIELGLCGIEPHAIEPDRIADILARARDQRCLAAAGLPTVRFDREPDMVFEHGTSLPGHPNGMVFRALDEAGLTLAEETYYSVGGGFVVTAHELAGRRPAPAVEPAIPYPFSTAATMLAMSQESGESIADMKRANELVALSEAELTTGLNDIWAAMEGCMQRGLAETGTLPGGLSVKRRAKQIHDKLLTEEGANAHQPHRVMDWLSVYAMAVNEENAAGGRVVTAPTNGAAGVIPAVISYYLHHAIGGSIAKVPDFLLTAAAIGGIVKHNASISGAEVGCQGEVGSASAMAAASEGLTGNGGYDGNLTGTARMFSRSSLMFAPVALPHGATVTSLLCGGSANRTDFKLSFTLRRNEPQQANVNMATVMTTFEGRGFQFVSTTSITSAVVDNARYNYYLEARLVPLDVGFCETCSIGFCRIGFR